VPGNCEKYLLRFFLKKLETKVSKATVCYKSLLQKSCKVEGFVLCCRDPRAVRGQQVYLENQEKQ